MNIPVFHPSMLPPNDDRPRRVFTIIDGEGQGDGVPVGVLTPIDPSPDPA